MPLFPKCPACKIGEVNNIKVGWFIFKKEKLLCNYCKAEFIPQDSLYPRYLLTNSDSKYNDEILTKAEWDFIANNGISNLEYVKKYNKLPILILKNANIILQKGEKSHLHDSARLYELRVETKYKTKSSGRIDAHKGGLFTNPYQSIDVHSESLPEISTGLKPVASGQLIMTNKRLVFTGEYVSRTIDLKDIVGIELHAIGFEVVSIKLARNLVFQVPDAEKWAEYIKVGVRR